MKKILIVCALAIVLATGTAFADHPSGWGIGIAGSWNGGWTGGGYPGLALSLKAPSIPVFWGLSMGFDKDYFSAGVTGDYYLIDNQLVPAIGLNWFLGLGGWLNYHHYGATHYGITSSYSSVAFGARLPIGLSWQPVNVLELFIDIAPSLGIAIDSDGKYSRGGIDTVYHEGGVKFPAGGWPIELGLRVWL